MKKLIVVFLLSAFMFNTVPLSSAAPYLSKSCKVGTVKVDHKYKYTCVKKGVWKKKLLLVKKQTPATPAPIIPIETNTTITSIPVEIKPEVVEQLISINNLPTDLVYKKSRESIFSVIKKSSYELDGLNIYIGSGIDPYRIENEKETLNNIAKLWSNIYKPDNKAHVVLYSFESLNWAQSKVREINASAMVRSGATCSIVYCGNATASTFSDGTLIIEQGMIGGSRNRATLAHEYTHLVQTSGSKNYWSTAPLWLVEGMAQFYGEAVGYSTFDYFNSTRKESHTGFANDFRSQSGRSVKSLLEQNTEQNTKTLMSMIEFPVNRSSGITALSYLIGGYATEVLVAVYGHETFEKFILSFKESNSWESNFYKAFGIHKDDFYGKITSYLYEMSKNL